MSDNSCYWDNRKERKAKAAAWVNKMDAEYKQEIIESEKGTELYDEGSYPPKWYTPETERIPKVTLLDCDTVSAIFTVDEDVKLAVLNFASFKNPGGKFLEGSSAQEESLCHESFLYNVLQHHDDVFYSVNRRMLNKGLYCNRALYTPDIVFFHNERKRKCDVITCAAPNYSVALKYNLVTKEENSATLRSRIRFVFDIAAANKVDTFILGAFGCGVFSQDAAEIAGIMADLLPNYCFKNIIFAIPDRNSKNYRAFVSVFKNWNEKLGQTKEINVPELKYMLEHQAEFQLCGRFLEWLRGKYAMFRLNVPREDPFFRGKGDYINEQEVLAEFFGIDLDAAENEREKLLSILRNGK